VAGQLRRLIAGIRDGDDQTVEAALFTLRVLLLSCRQVRRAR
jgi:hypothetical protein